MLILGVYSHNKAQKQMFKDAERVKFKTVDETVPLEFFPWGLFWCDRLLALDP